MRMRKALMVATIITLTVLFSSTVFAAAWNVPANARLVQKSNTDTAGRIYGTIQAAINSIPTGSATATNPFVVKVMPGVYNEVVTMRPYVDVEGSGPESTVITASNANVDNHTCSVGTVVMASNSSIRNLKVVNMPPAQNGSGNAVGAIIFNNVTASAEGIHVLAGSDTLDGGRLSGVCATGTTGASPQVKLNNVNIETYNNGGDGAQSNAIMIFTNASLNLTNSKLTSLSSGIPSVHVINCPLDNDIPGSGIATITVVNSTLDGINPADVVSGIHLTDGYKALISSSIITISSGVSYGEGFFVGENTDLTMVDSKVISNQPIAYGVNGNAKIANSLLCGDIGNLLVSNVKFFNNYDCNFNPISNQ